MMSIKMIVGQVFARWATDVAPAWGEGRYTPNDDQFAEMAAEAIQADRAQRSPTSAPANTLPNEDEVLHAIEASDGAFLRYSGHRVCLPKGNWNDEQWAEFHRDWPHKPQESFRREALAKLYGDVSTVARAKAEALREAAECIVLREDQVGCPSCRVNAEAEAEVWLRDRAAATENSVGCG